ncbi:hypothetical protein G6F56_011153 [Rhizopus delemar]|uniref:Uncharacterized protein n=1 Tax=Rhizopus stolonifer TaxID=4846 RepID=A0A367KUN9_RHIST|nr:hypothetical protein G6F56_011153 [Rhizopus delemar]RCI05916.1 hypothetical protein CU098_011236 [Rhizopus stolonifer]
MSNDTIERDLLSPLQKQPLETNSKLEWTIIATWILLKIMHGLYPIVLNESESKIDQGWHSAFSVFKEQIAIEGAANELFMNRVTLFDIKEKWEELAGKYCEMRAAYQRTDIGGPSPDNSFIFYNEVGRVLEDDYSVHIGSTSESESMDESGYHEFREEYRDNEDQVPDSQRNPCKLTMETVSDRIGKPSERYRTIGRWKELEQSIPSPEPEPSPMSTVIQNKTVYEERMRGLINFSDKMARERREEYKTKMNALIDKVKRYDGAGRDKMVKEFEEKMNSVGEKMAERAMERKKRMEQLLKKNSPSSS